jgi:2-polyprenyl-3-methyl-5-hydroxy-6-metoxy-1,4-benzoquinol methylase
VTTSYGVYSNTHERAKAHHDYLSTMLDAHTMARLSGLRVPLAGARILELGAGAGSIAHWLADTVGPDGQVMATDIKPLDIPDHPRLTVLVHNVVTEPLPDGLWHVIHARLLLMHLPERRQVLGRLAGALHPGGALVIEEMDMTWQAGRSMRAPTDADRHLYEYYHDMVTALFVAEGAEPGWACQVPQAMTDAGLVDVSTHIHGQGWSGGTAGALFMAGGSHQMQDRLLAGGLSNEHLQRIRDLMSDPRMMIRVSPLVSTVGYRQ